MNRTASHTTKRGLLARLRTNGLWYLISALLLVLVIPIYQLLVLTPQGYGDALHAAGTGAFATYLSWISGHGAQFIIYRVLLIVAFALLLTLPFSLFRVIVAQEIMGQQEREAEEAAEEGEDREDEEREDGDGMPANAWRGKGFVIIAAWAGMAGLVVYVLAAVVGTFYLSIVSRGFTAQTAVPGNFATFASLFSILTQTVGVGLLALSTLFFGAMIARSGRNLWPGVWVAFSYLALAVAALLSGSAVGVAGAPTEGQAALTSPAILLFALWVLWLGVMLVRLKPEQ